MTITFNCYWPFMHRVPANEPDCGYRILRRHTDNPTYVIEYPWRFTQDDMQSEYWPEIKMFMLENVRNVYKFIVEEQIEKGQRWH